MKRRHADGVAFSVLRRRIHAMHRHEFEDIRKTTDLFARIKKLDEDMAEEQLYYDGITPRILAEKFNMSAGTDWDSTYIAPVKIPDVERIMQKKHMSRAVIRAVMIEINDSESSAARLQSGKSQENTDLFVRKNIAWINRTMRKKIAGCGTLLGAVRAVKGMPDMITCRYIEREVIPWLLHKQGRLYMLRTVRMNRRKKDEKTYVIPHCTG